MKYSTTQSESDSTDVKYLRLSALNRIELVYEASWVQVKHKETSSSTGKRDKLYYMVGFSFQCYVLAHCTGLMYVGELPSFVFTEQFRCR